jgi:hypothetical protein
MEPAVEVERGAVVPLPIVQAVVPAVKAPALPQGSTPALIDLTVDDSPTDKGKQEAVIEMVEASDQAGTSAALGGDHAEASARWPDFARLALVRAEEELPRWGRSTLQFRDASNPSAEPFFALDDKDEVRHWEYLKGLQKHSLQSLRMVSDTLVRSMSKAFEVSRFVSLFLCFIPRFSLVLIVRF